MLPSVSKLRAAGTSVDTRPGTLQNLASEQDKEAVHQLTGDLFDSAAAR